MVPRLLGGELLAYAGYVAAYRDVARFDGGPSLGPWTTLRIVVSQAGVTVATWNNIRLASDQTWESPALTVTGNGPAQVVALHDGTVVASLSSR